MTPSQLLSSPSYAHFCITVNWLCTLTADLPVDILRALRTDPVLMSLEADVERRLENEECTLADVREGCAEWMCTWLDHVDPARASLQRAKLVAKRQAVGIPS